jgi:Tol biopolymer transport system component
VSVTQAIESLGARGGSVRPPTDAAYENGSPSFSPDGESIVYKSKRTSEAAANVNTDLWKVNLSP